MAVIGAGHDYYSNPFTGGDAAGAELLLGSAIYRPDVMLEAILDNLVTGAMPSGPTDFSFSSGTLDVMIPESSPLSQAARDITRDVILRLSSGELSTGINPLTGDEE